jgi:hypothetical protein
MKIELILNTEHPYEHYLENLKGEKFYFNPHKPNGESINDFLMDAKEII